MQLGLTEYLSCKELRPVVILIGSRRRNVSLQCVCAVIERYNGLGCASNRKVCIELSPNFKTLENMPDKSKGTRMKERGNDGRE